MRDDSPRLPIHSLPSPRRFLLTGVLLLAATLLGPARRAHAQEPGQPVPDSLQAAQASAEASMAAMDCGGTGQVSRGFVLQTGLGGRLASLATAMSPDTGAGFEWNLLAGYKICRVTVGVSLDVLASSAAGTSQVATSFTLAPEVQVALARSNDRKAELIGAINLGLGETGGNFRLSGMVAPGVRYWVHRHIALSTLVGLAGAVLFQGKAGQSALLNLFGNIGVLGAF